MGFISDIVGGIFGGGAAKGANQAAGMSKEALEWQKKLFEEFGRPWSEFSNEQLMWLDPAFKHQIGQFLNYLGAEDRYDTPPKQPIPEWMKVPGAEALPKPNITDTSKMPGLPTAFDSSKMPSIKPFDSSKMPGLPTAFKPGDMPNLPGKFQSGAMPPSYSIYGGTKAGLQDVPDWRKGVSDLQNQMRTIGDIGLAGKQKAMSSQVNDMMARRGLTKSSGAISSSVGMSNAFDRARSEEAAKAALAGADYGGALRGERTSNLLNLEGLKQAETDSAMRRFATGREEERADYSQAMGKYLTGREAEGQDFERSMGRFMTGREEEKSDFNALMQKFLTGREAEGQDFQSAMQRFLTGAGIGDENYQKQINNILLGEERGRMGRSEEGANYWNVLNQMMGIPAQSSSQISSLVPWANVFGGMSSGAANLAQMYGNQAGQNASGLGNLLGWWLGGRNKSGMPSWF